MEYIEKQTPCGITIKVMTKKWNFIAFAKEGNVIYADESQGKVLHKIPVLILLGAQYHILKNSEAEFEFFKINKGKAVIPYTSGDWKVRKYLFIESDEKVDLLPVRIKEIRDISSLLRGKESGIIPDYVIIDNNISDEDCIIIKNRFPNVTIIEIGDDNPNAKKGEETASSSASHDAKTADDFEEKNLNIMSNNPVFLARIHLRDMSLSKVNQLLLDFDISSLEADYVLKFIENLLNNTEGREDVEQNRSKLENLRESFQFYIYLMNRNEKEIQNMINNIEDSNKLASYNTLIAKMRTLFTAKKDLLVLTDYENLLYEKKEQLQK